MQSDIFFRSAQGWGSPARYLVLLHPPPVGCAAIRNPLYIGSERMTGHGRSSFPNLEGSGVGQPRPATFPYPSIISLLGALKSKSLWHCRPAKNFAILNSEQPFAAPALRKGPFPRFPFLPFRYTFRKSFAAGAGVPPTGPCPSVQTGPVYHADVHASTFYTPPHSGF